MIAVHCPRHGCEVLLSNRRITGFAHTDDGLVVHWVCWCGHRGAHRPVDASSERAERDPTGPLTADSAR